MQFAVRLRQYRMFESDFKGGFGADRLEDFACAGGVEHRRIADDANGACDSSVLAAICDVLHDVPYRFSEAE